MIGIGRNPLRPAPFSLDIDKRDRYAYHAFHVTHEREFLLNLLDMEKPEVIINFAAQGRGAVSLEVIIGGSLKPIRCHWFVSPKIS